MSLLSLCSFTKVVVGGVQMGQTIFSVLKKKRKMKTQRNMGSYTKTLTQLTISPSMKALGLGYYLNRRWYNGYDNAKLGIRINRYSSCR